MKKTCLLLLLLFTSHSLFIQCTTEATSDLEAPSLTTLPISNVGSDAANSGGTITSEGSSAITAKGLVWDTSINPTTVDYSTNEGPGSNSFVSSLTGLQPSTSYYVRAYATNSEGTTYGNQYAFMTNSSGIPSLATSAISSILPTSAAGGGTVTANGGSTILARGIVWDTAQNPTLANSNTVNGSGMGTFTSSLTGLTANTVYYVRAYATNSNGTGYGNQVTFSTSAVAGSLATLTTTAITGITTVSSASGGNITADGGSAITARGVVWATTQNPTLANSKTTDGTGTGTFTSSLTGLTSNTTYYVRAYATNGTGTAYGNQVNFTTSVLPTYTVGSIGPGGGYVFFVGSDGHGYEIVPASKEFVCQWGCPTSNITGTSSSASAGQANTNIILQYHTAINYYANPIQCQEVVMATGDVAAKKCDEIVFNGFSDWYMPSIGQLSLAQTNLIQAGLSDLSNNELYGSSTQSTANTRMFMALQTSNGSTWGDWKYDLIRVRAVRNF